MRKWEKERNLSNWNVSFNMSVKKAQFEHCTKLKQIVFTPLFLFYMQKSIWKYRVLCNLLTFANTQQDAEILNYEGCGHEVYSEATVYRHFLV